MIEKEKLYFYEISLYKELNYKNISMLMDYVYYCYYLSFIDKNKNNIYFNKAKKCFSILSSILMILN